MPGTGDPDGDARAGTEAGDEAARGPGGRQRRPRGGGAGAAPPAPSDPAGSAGTQQQTPPARGGGGDPGGSPMLEVVRAMTLADPAGRPGGGRRGRAAASESGSSGDADAEEDDGEGMDGDEGGIAVPGGDGEGHEGGREVRRRRRLTPEETQLLLATFAHTQTPPAQMRAQLGARLHMSPRAIQIWFQNRRAKLKRQAAQAALLSPPPPPPPAALDPARLPPTMVYRHPHAPHAPYAQQPYPPHALQLAHGHAHAALAAAAAPPLPMRHAQYPPPLAQRAPPPQHPQHAQHPQHPQHEGGFRGQMGQVGQVAQGPQAGYPPSGYRPPFRDYGYFPPLAAQPPAPLASPPQGYEWDRRSHGAGRFAPYPQPHYPARPPAPPQAWRSQQPQHPRAWPSPAGEGMMDVDGRREAFYRDPRGDRPQPSRPRAGSRPQAYLAPPVQPQPGDDMAGLSRRRASLPPDFLRPMLPPPPLPPSSEESDPDSPASDDQPAAPAQVHVPHTRPRATSNPQRFITEAEQTAVAVLQDISGPRARYAVPATSARTYPKQQAAQGYAYSPRPRMPAALPRAAAAAPPPSPVERRVRYVPKPSPAPTVQHRRGTSLGSFPPPRPPSPPPSPQTESPDPMDLSPSTVPPTPSEFSVPVTRRPGHRRSLSAPHVVEDHAYALLDLERGARQAARQLFAHLAADPLHPTAADSALARTHRADLAASRFPYAPLPEPPALPTGAWPGELIPGRQFEARGREVAREVGRGGGRWLVGVGGGTREHHASMVPL
ncbi:hypothetical protein DFJ74DRAFT_645092 [Hyaloraphidium curvatum]|nr:hypothetical protein DFJ74DRAFT_645092 [Hyaloraphidium curvatum]